MTMTLRHAHVLVNMEFGLGKASGMLQQGLYLKYVSHHPL